MLRVTEIADAGAAKAYYASQDYYLEGQEEPSHWHGLAAAKLGLSGPVVQEQFNRLADGLHPETGDKLLARYRGNRRVGYDFTFSLPKSMSLAYALGDDDRLGAAFCSAVDQTMQEVERDMATRVRKKGEDVDRTTGNMVWADFLHKTSRPIKGQPDPQLHIHAVAFNLTYDAKEHEWKAGQFGQLKADAPYYQAAFRSRLANNLTELGYGIRKTKDDFELSHIPLRAIKEFSRRTKQIDDLAERLGITRPETKAKLGATSREKKTKGLTWDDLLGLWRERLSSAELDAIENHVAADEPQHNPAATREAVDYALAHLTYRDSTVPERAVVTEALKFGLGDVTVDGVWKELGRPGLIRRNDGMLTTREVLSEEKRIVQFAVEGRGKYRPLGRELRAGIEPASPASESNRPEQFRAPIPDAAAQPDPATPSAFGQAASLYTSAPRTDTNPAGLYPSLSPSQQAAIRHVWSSPDRVMLIEGKAGVGKTTLLKPLLAGINLPWVAVATSADASRINLRKDPFFAEADTLATFFRSKELQQKVKGGLLVLDEASMTGAKDFARLSQLADSLSFRILAVGDPGQHKSVSRGHVMSLLADKAKLPVALVDDIQRQKQADHAGYLKAAALLARGEHGRAFDVLDRMGWVKDAKLPVLVDDFMATLKAGREPIVVVPTHAEGRNVTEALRDRLKKEGVLGEEREFRSLRNLQYTDAELEQAKKEKPAGVVLTRFGAFTPETVHFAVGDRIRITGGGKDLAGKRIDNGSVFTLTGFTDGGNLRVENDDSGIARVLSQDFLHWRPGYVETSHGAQGKTRDVPLVWMPASTFGAVKQPTAYVSATRGTKRLSIYTDDKAGLRGMWQREERHTHALDLVKQPTAKVRKRLKKFLAFLSKSATVSLGKVLHKDQQREWEPTL